MIPSSLQAEARSDSPAILTRHWILAASVLVFLWFTLISQLGAEWSVNPQYAYGWAVPFLSLYLLIRRIRRNDAIRLHDQETTGIPDDRGSRGRLSVVSGQWSVVSSQWSVVSWSLLILGSLLYLPTRLVQEANPEWRLVSWALAFEVIGITLALACLFIQASRDSRFTFPPKAFGVHASRVTHHVSRIAPSSLLFPLFFFLVSVPWPTLIETPVIQWLARANASSTIEILGFLGLPALQHGNLIEVGTGVVGIDEACSGIRSVQATLMLSLFFGEFYSLPVLRRFICALAGFGLSFLFNIGRTTLLTLIAARKGMNAIDQWHDPAGATILVGCFICLWLVAKVQSPKSKVQSPEVFRDSPSGPISEQETPTTHHTSRVTYPPKAFGVHVSLITSCLALWLALAEIGTELWYRVHESRLPAPVCWEVNLPRENPGFRLLPPSQTSKQFLHYDNAINDSWKETDHSSWQAIFLRWKPGRIAVHLARNHTPEICLAASGRRVLSQSSGHVFSACGLRLPFNIYRVKDEAGPFYVFYCLWDDRSENQAANALELSYSSRLGPVLEGRRNSGQRSLEVAVWGINDEARAEAAFERQLQRLIQFPDLPRQPSDPRY